jgi:hypothetical protein
MCDGDMVVDLRLLRGVSVDADRGRVMVGGGATWRDVDAPLVAQGLTMPGGTFDTTGVAGLTLGGGLGDELTLMAYVAGDLLHVTVCAFGDRDRWNEPVRRLRETLAVAEDGLGLNSYLQIQVMQGDTPFGIRHYWKSHFVNALSDELIEDIVEHYTGRAAGRDSSILIEPLHGQARRAPLEDTAWNRRDPGYNVSVLGHWRDPAIDDVEIGWVRAGAALVAAHSQDGGEYLNYGAPDEPADRVRAAFGDAKYERLRAIKHRYDPDNLFRYNHNIPPQR